MSGTARLWILACAALITLSAGIGLRDPWPPDEPRYALVASEFANDGAHWLFPTRAGEAYAEKPPLFLWAIAGVQALGLPLRVAALLPSLLAGLATLAIVVATARRLWNTRVAVHAGWALLISLQFTHQARWGQIDAFLGLWTTAALALLVLLFCGRSPAPLRYAAGAGLAMGLGVLSKGVGFVPLLLLAPLLWLRRRGLLSRPIWPTLGLAAFSMLAVIALWLIPLLLSTQTEVHAAARDRLLLHQTVVRYFAAWHHAEHPPWYYLPQALVLWLPVTLLLPWLLPAWWHRWQRGDRPTILLTAWVVVVLVFFTISPGKRGVYLYPALPALILAAAPCLGALCRRRPARIIAGGISAILVLAAVLAAPPASAWWPERLVQAMQRQGLSAADLTPSLILALALMAALATGFRLGAVRSSLACITVGWTVVGWAMLPALNEARFPARFCAEARQQAGPDVALGMVGFREQHLLADPDLVTFGYTASIADQHQRAEAWLRAHPHRALIIPEDRLGDFARSSADLIDLGLSHRQRFYLLRPSDLGHRVDDPGPDTDSPP